MNSSQWITFFLLLTSSSWASLPNQLCLNGTPVVHRSAIHPACPSGRTVVHVQLNSQILNLCESGNVIDYFPVAIGFLGPGKMSEGDFKTPIGEYPLGKPTSSVNFGLFIPVGYPTSEQIRSGYTGSQIGIHGAYQTHICGDEWKSNLNWTDGCIAVDTTEQISKIADFVNQHPNARILIQ